LKSISGESRLAGNYYKKPPTESDTIPGKNSAKTLKEIGRSEKDKGGNG